MTILFLGTGGADWPVKNTENMRLFRHHACVLVNGKVLIDLGPGILDYAKTIEGVDISEIEAIVLTHTHEDHWNTDELAELLKITKTSIKLFYHSSAKANLGLEEDGIHGKALPKRFRNKLILCPMRRLQKIEAGGCVWQNLEANHYAPAGERGSHYIITEGKETWLYGCDGGWFTTKTWDVLRNNKFSGVILDGTIGENSGDYRIAGHNSLAMNKLLLEAMRQQGMLAKGAGCYLSHFGMTTYENGQVNIAKKVEDIGFLEAKDGLLVQ
ncbi:MAG: MBL fold metallo-hydrolase [Butyrivibrio sp.]|nr:MBL fold metallo-hydrolase [Butyrivibrio sp.]